jgi:cobalt/nickel transport system permease protein
MHMADALISPEVGGAMWAVTAGLVAWSAKKLKEDPDEGRIPRWVSSGPSSSRPR